MLNQGGEKDINSIIGIVLIFAILIGYSIYTQPSPEEIQAAKIKRDSLEVVSNANETSSVEPKTDTDEHKDEGQSNPVETNQNIPSRGESDANVQMLQKYGEFSDAAYGEEQLLTMENDRVKITLNTMGGGLHTVELKNYKTFDSLPVYLLKDLGVKDNGPDSCEFNMIFSAGTKTISTRDLYFKPKGSSFKVEGDNTKTISLRLYAGDDKYIEYEYSLSGDSYVLGFKINFHGVENIISRNNSYLVFDWSNFIPRQEKSLINEKRNSTIYYKYFKDEVDYLSETSDERKDLQTKVKWVAFKQQFFSSILVAESSFDKPTNIESISSEDDGEYVKEMHASFTIPYGHVRDESFPMFFYFGPTHYKTLQDYGLGFEKIIPLGWGIFGWVNKGLIIPMFNFLGKYIGNYGIIILIMTIFIKMLLFPLMYKSYKSTAKMRVLKPEVDKINDKFPDKADAMKKQQSVMALYKKTGVNPLGGCLPMLVQFPILIAMYRFFPASIELRQESFLWATDLSSYDSIYDFPNGFSIPFYGDHVSLFTLLMTAATLLSVKMNTEMSGGGQMQMPQMKIMMYMMPIMFLGFFNDFASALSYYYFIATLITFGQQYAMRRFIDEEAILQKINEHQKKPAPKKSNFQKRLEKMAKERGYKPNK